MTQFTAPTGRLVWGDPTKLRQKTDQLTNAPRTKHDGTPLMTCDFGVAYSKADPATAPFMALLRAADKAAFPQFHDAAGNPTLPTFADKITDGDSQVPNKKGKKPCERDGYAGHWVVSYSRATGDTPPLKRHDGTRWVDMDPAGLDCGDYVIIGGSTTSNDSAQSPGMYRNVDMVGFVGKGQRIITGRDADEALGAAPPALPAGATATPQAPADAPLPSAPPAPYDAHLPPPPSAPEPDGPVMTAKANGAPYEAFIAKGWTEETLRAQGFIQ